MSLAVMKFILNGSDHIIVLHTHTHTHKQRVGGLDDFPTSTWYDHDKQITHD